MAKGKDGSDKKPLCFVIGPIGSTGTPERKQADLLLNLVIKEVLEKEEFGYAVRRADEDARPGMIGDRVITDVVHAELVIADLTGLNPNAFYELGIRHSALQPTIHMAQAGTTLPFDNIGHGTIFVDLADYQSIVVARSQLAESARVIKDTDFKVSNPITQANASFKMRESADPRDRVLAELQERISNLEATRRSNTNVISSISPARRSHDFTQVHIQRMIHRLDKDGATWQDVTKILLDSNFNIESVTDVSKQLPGKIRVNFRDTTSFDFDWFGKPPVFKSNDET